MVGSAIGSAVGAFMAAPYHGEQIELSRRYRVMRLPFFEEHGFDDASRGWFRAIERLSHLCRVSFLRSSRTTVGCSTSAASIASIGSAAAIQPAAPPYYSMA